MNATVKPKSKHLHSKFDLYRNSEEISPNQAKTYRLSQRIQKLRLQRTLKVWPGFEIKANSIEK